MYKKRLNLYPGEVCTSPVVRNHDRKLTHTRGKAKESVQQPGISPGLQCPG